MLLDLAQMVPPSYFDVDHHPTIKQYINTKSNWFSLDHGSMRMKSYLAHKRARKDPNYSGSCLPFKDCPETHLFLHAIDHVLMKYGNKPPYHQLDNKSLNLHKAIIPTAFLQTLVERQQMPHLDYHHKELKQFAGANSHSTSIKPWSMDIPLSPDGLFLSMYGSYTDYVKWRDNDHSSTTDSSNEDNHFANPPICVYVPQGSVLLWKLVNCLCPSYLHCEQRLTKPLLLTNLPAHYKHARHQPPTCPLRTNLPALPPADQPARCRPTCPLITNMPATNHQPARCRPTCPLPTDQPARYRPTNLPAADQPARRRPTCPLPTNLPAADQPVRCWPTCPLPTNRPLPTNLPAADQPGHRWPTFPPLTYLPASNQPARRSPTCPRLTNLPPADQPVRRRPTFPPPTNMTPTIEHDWKTCPPLTNPPPPSMPMNQGW
jgi:hypothetical protein